MRHLRMRKIRRQMGTRVPIVSTGVGKYTRGLFDVAKSNRLARRLKLPPLLDGLLNDHVYTSRRMGSNQSKFSSLWCTKRTPSLPQTQAPPSLAPTQAPPILAPTQAPPSLAPTQAPLGLAPTQASPILAPSRRIPKIRFRVLVLGRANAGKTSVLQRVCDTTASPKIYRGGEEVRGTNLVCESDLTADSSNLNRRWMLVILVLLFICPLTSCQRGEHTIDDELVFSNHTSYVFHDSRGIESGGTEELETLRRFIGRKCGEKELQKKLHAIWFAWLPFS